MINLSKQLQDRGSSRENKLEKKPLRKAPIALAVGMALAGSVQVYAQGDSVSAEEQEWLLEEIVVTATKRETSLQDTGMSVSVLSGKDLAARGITSITDVISTVPGVDLSRSAPGRSEVIMRGISTDAGGLAAIATTASYLDDTVLFRGVSDVRMVDIERVEVLKGPQGTLYGKSAMGGVIRYITNKPDATEFSGGVSSYLSSTEQGGSNYGLQGYANIPLAENLALRMVAYDYNNDGFIDTPVSGEKDVNTEDTVGGRVALKWDVDESASVELNYLYQDIELGGFQAISSMFTPTPYTWPPVAPPDLTLASVSSNLENWNIGESDSVQYDILNLKLRKEFTSFSAELMAAKKEENSVRVRNNGMFVAITEGTAIQETVTSTDAETIELRLLSNTESGQFVDWIAGLWYENSNLLSRNTSTYRGPEITNFFGAFPGIDGAVNEDFGNVSNYLEKSVYGEVGFNFTSKARLTLGYRYADITTYRSFVYAHAFFDILTGKDDLAALGSDDKVEKPETYKFGFEYRLNDDVLLYTIASSGYRTGGLNIGSIRVRGTSFDSDSLWNYEIGAKTGWLDGRLTANASLYRLDWEDLQLTTRDPITFTVFKGNVGRAIIDGLELEFNYQIENVKTGFNYTYTDAHLEEDYDQGNAKAGDPLPGSGRNKYSLFVDWRHELNRDMDLTLRATHRYIGSRLNAMANLATEMDSYQVTDLRATLVFNEDLSVALFADNVFDEVAETSYADRSHGFRISNITRPRVVGLNVAYEF